MCPIVSITILLSRNMSHPLCYSTIQKYVSPSLLHEYPYVWPILSGNSDIQTYSNPTCFSNFQILVASSMFLQYLVFVLLQQPDINPFRYLTKKNIYINSVLLCSCNFFILCIQYLSCPRCYSIPDIHPVLPFTLGYLF